MNRRTTLMSIALLSLVACAFPQASFAQSSPLIGTWKLNLEKSKFPPTLPAEGATLVVAPGAAHEFDQCNVPRRRCVNRATTRGAPTLTQREYAVLGPRRSPLLP